MKYLLLTFFALLFSGLIYGQECGVIYVTPSGASSGTAGTKANPANLTYGLTLVNPGATRIWMASGNYSISVPIQLVNNVQIDGGFDGLTWTKSNATPTVINKDNTNVIPAPANALVAFIGASVSGFRLQDLTINVADATAAQVSVYGVYLNGCSNYNIVRCNVTTGDGGDGVNGNNGVAGTAGGNGAAGLPGNANENPQPGGAGGTAVGGGNGGNGGAGGKHQGSTAPPPGQNGLPGGCGGIGGNPGTGPECVLGCFGGSPSCSSVTPGTAGTAGSAGANGTNGTNGTGAVAFGYYAPGNGTNGTDGATGCGGGGGGGGGGRQNSGLDDVGGSGGGGGGGGSGGTAGTGGTGGGGSFAVFLVSNGANGLVKDCNLTAGTGGTGGIGGTGSAGGTGGAGGAGGAAGPCPNGVGGAGGSGGSGGTGGNGGNGADGWSFPIYESGGTAVTQQTINSVPGNPPVISVQNTGCTGVDAIFTATTAASWNFGAGATPATANGTGPFNVQYSTQGRKTINFSGTDFADFVDIFNSPTNVGNIITATPNPIQAGCLSSFTSTLAGTYYNWIFPSGVLTGSTAGATEQTTDSARFLSAGTYQVILEITTAQNCCGPSYDTLNVTVLPNSNNVTLSFTPDTICAGQSVTFTASTGYQLYTFAINNIPVQQSTSNTFVTAALNPGDVVSVSAFDGSCYPGDDTIVPFYSLPNISVSISDIDSTICANDNVIFTVAPASYYAYEFFVNGVSVQTSSLNTYSTTNLTDGSVVTAIARKGTCSSNTSNPIPVAVIPIPNADAGNQQTLCSDDLAVTLTGTPVGGTWSGTGIVFGTNFDPVLSGSGVFTLTYTYTDPVAGCSDDDTVSVSVNLRDNTIAGLDTSTCENSGTFVLPIGSPAGGVWTPTGTVTSGGLVDPAAIGAGVYTLTYTSVSSCPKSDDLVFTVIAAPNADAGLQQSLTCEIDEVTLNGSSTTDSVKFKWNDNLGDTNVITVSVAGTYTLSVTDTNGCVSTSDVTVLPKGACGTEIAIPTAFTPNDDGKNDVFKAQYTADPDDFEIHIYNRWGELLFTSSDIAAGWDGKHKGVDAPFDTYTWWVSYTAENGNKKNVIGNFVLLR